MHPFVYYNSNWVSFVLNKMKIFKIFFDFVNAEISQKKVEFFVFVTSQNQSNYMFFGLQMGSAFVKQDKKLQFF